jgi:hypothetical protein
MGPIPPIPRGKVAVKICRWVIVDLPKLDQIAKLLGIDEADKAPMTVTIIVPKTRHRSKRKSK